MSPYLAFHRGGTSKEEGNSLTDQSSVSDREDWNTVGTQKGLEDSKGAVTSLGHESMGSEATAQGQTWQLEAWPCSHARGMEGEVDGTSVCQTPWVPLKWRTIVLLRRVGIQRPQRRQIHFGNRRAQEQERTGGSVHNLDDIMGPEGESRGNPRTLRGYGVLGEVPRTHFASPRPSLLPRAWASRARTQWGLVPRITGPTNGGRGRGRRALTER